MNTNLRLALVALMSTVVMGAAAAQSASTKGATEPLHFKPADARLRKLLAPVKDMQRLLEGDFAVALADLDGDGHNEIIAKAEMSPMNCGRDGACATVVLQQRGPRIVTLLADQNTLDPLALTTAKYGGWRALAFVDEKGRIQIGQRPGTPLYRKPMVYPMHAPRGTAVRSIGG